MKTELTPSLTSNPPHTHTPSSHLQSWIDIGALFLAMGFVSNRLLQSFVARAAACKSFGSRRRTSRSSLPFARGRGGYSSSFPGPMSLLLATSGLDSRDYSSQSMESRASLDEEVPGFYADFCDLLSYASAHGPGFQVDANSVEIVKDPASFYDQLVVRERPFLPVELLRGETSSNRPCSFPL